MTDAQGSARDHVETEWTEATEDIPGQRTANIPQKKRNDGASRLEQNSVRHSVKGITQACREGNGMGRKKKEKKTKAKRMD
jgi:hypothetical protein